MKKKPTTEPVEDDSTDLSDALLRRHGRRKWALDLMAVAGFSSAMAATLLGLHGSFWGVMAALPALLISIFLLWTNFLST